jgi:hypothetical protein
MKVKEQIKQKVISLSMRAEDFFHRFRSRLEGPPKPRSSKKTSKPAETGHIRTYYNTSKEERKLH